MISWIWALGAVCLGQVSLALLWIRRRRRILRLDWPEKFQNWQSLKRHCALFLRNQGWNVQHPASNGLGFDLVIRRRSSWMEVTFLIEKDYWDRLPEDFMTRLVRFSQKRGRAQLLVTDFKMDDEIVARANKGGVYPVWYKDLPRLETIVPSTKQFRKPRPEQR